MGTVTSEDWRYATLGVEALNRGDVRERTAAFVADGVDEQPRNRTRILSIYARNDFARDPADVSGFPCRSGEMFAEQLAILVEELCVGSLEHPRKLASIFLADVDLVALGVDLEKKFLAAERLEPRRDFSSGRQRETKATMSKTSDARLRST